MSIPSLKVLVAVTSPTALSRLGESSLLVSAATAAREFSRETGQRSPISVAVTPELVGQAQRQLFEAGIENLPLICDPNDPRELVKVLQADSSEFEIVAIHDSNRPLTRVAQFHRTLEALLNECDAVRCTAAFTETLKSVDPDGVIEYTIDRTSVRRISTPEIFRTAFIDFSAKPSHENGGWFLPLKKKARIGYVDSDPESIRVNSDEELSLLESFLHWQQTVAR